MRVSDFQGVRVYRAPAKGRRTGRDGAPVEPKRLGKVHFAVFSPGGRRVVGFMVKLPDVVGMIKQPDRFVALDALEIYEGVLCVEDLKENFDAAAAKRLGVDLDTCLIWTGMDVVAQGGERLGYCADAVFSGKTGKVDLFVLTEGDASAMLVGNREMPASLLKGYRDGAMIVSDEAVELALTGGVAAKAAEASVAIGAKAKEGAAKAKKEVAKLKLDEKGAKAVDKGSRAQRRPGAQYLHHSQGFGRRTSGRRPRRRDARRPYAIIAVACAALLFIASVVWYLNRGVTVSLNGSDVSVRINSSVQQLIDDNQLSYRAGDLLAVDDTVLEKRGGERYSVKVDDEQIDNDDLSSTALTGGETIEIGNGRDEYEEHEVIATEIQPTLTVKGTGAIQYVQTWGVPGRSEVWVGSVSGKTADRGVVQEVQDCVVRATSVSPDEGSYVALTFDEGPSSYTEQIVSILEEKGVGATFFLQGDRSEEHQAAARAIADAGFELGSNSYSDTDLTALSGDDLRSQITRGFDAVKDASGVETSLLRAPYGLFSESSWSEAMDLVSAVVSWNLDSGDYLLPGAGSVVDTVMGSVANGNIILLTDNETTGAQTVDALPQLIDSLQAQGFTLVSLSDLIATDSELAEELDVSRVSMPDDAALPQVKKDTADQDA